MVDIPNIAFATAKFEVPPFGRLVWFDVYDLCFFTHMSDEENEIQLQLRKGGAHRNLFLLDSSGQPEWRVSDYHHVPPQLDDSITDIFPTDNAHIVKAITYGGNVLHVDVTNGQATWIEWTKS